MAGRPRWVVLVVGMHRSGTSALTRAISLLGADLPVRLMAAQKSNPLGHFEPVQIVALHDLGLASIGTSWSDWRRIPEEWFKSLAAERLKLDLAAAVGEDYGDSDLFVVKDPRLCRILPIWKDLAARLGIRLCFVLPYRNPLEVARSLASRDGLVPASSYLLWVRHVLDAERGTRDGPRVFLSYEELLKNPRSTMERIIAGTPVRWPRDPDAFDRIEGFIKPELRHNASDASEMATRAEVPKWVRDTHACLGDLRLDPKSAAARRALDRIRNAFDPITDLFGAAAQGEAKPLVAKLEATAETLARTEAALAEAQSLAVERAHALESLQARLDRTQARLAEIGRLARDDDADAGRHDKPQARAKGTRSGRKRRTRPGDPSPVKRA